MKKTFVQPKAQMVAVEAESILANSTMQSGGSNSGGGPTSADVRYNPTESGDVFLMN